MFKLFNVLIRVSSNNYRYHTSNNFEQLIDKKGGLEFISIITNPILTTIGINIGQTGFFKASVSKVVFDKDRRILKGLVIIEKICAKLIFDKSFDFN